MASGPVTRRLARLTARLGAIDAAVVTAAGEAVHDAMMDQVSADTGGDQALSGVAGGRYRLALDLTPLRAPAGVRIRPKDRQSGMWALLDKGHRGGYTVAAKKRRTSRKRKAGSRGAAMNIAGGGWHAGPFTVRRRSSGKHTWTKGRDKGYAAAADRIRDVL